MRILAFYPYIPYPLNRGAYQRAFYLLRELARDHEIDFVALSEGGEGLPHQKVFAEFCRQVHSIPFQHPAWERLFPKRLANRLPATVAHWTLPQAAEAIDRLMEKERYDAVQVFDIILAQYFMRAHCHVPLIADRTRVDLQYQLMEQRHMAFSLKARLLNLENLFKLWRYERAVAERCRLEVVCGPDDESFVRRYVSKRADLAVIPNGVDIDYFHPQAAGGTKQAERPTVIFCGAMDYNPNIDALRWYFSSIDGPLRKEVSDLRVLIVGKDPTPEVKAYASLGHVTVTGGVPDVRPYYRQAWLQIVPLRIGGGTRLKIVESMAMGTPVVSTTIGAQGLDLKHQADVFLGDTVADFVNATARALNDRALRERVRDNGLHTARSRLSWPVLGEQLRRAYAERFESTSVSGSVEEGLLQVH